MEARLARRFPDAIAGLLLPALVAAIYWRVSGFGFVELDDPLYVIGNPVVSGGLTAGGVRWAFSSTTAANWHPLAWISHMLDVTMFGMDAGRHHVTSVLIHAANSVLLFRWLRRATGRDAEAGLVAALFAVHPLHVESVAWIAERKDVLCAFFFLAALDAYGRYREAPSRGRYLAVLLLHALALMAKPMAVTFPFVLMLLDRWPYRAGGLRETLPEKLPLLLMSAAASWAAWNSQAAGGAMATAGFLPAASRAAIAAHSYAGYLRKTFAPSSLAAFYPIPRLEAMLPGALLSGTFLAAITAGAALQARRRPWIAVGWLWYLGMLVPVAGFVQVGMQSMADRYTYLPLVGIFLVLARAVGEAVGRLPAARIPAAVACGAALLALTGAARAQVGSWADTETLYRHAAEAVPGNWFAHQGLAGLAIRDGRRDEALSHLREVLRVGPAYNDFQYSVFRGRGGGGEDEAAEFLREVDRWNLADAARMRQFGLAKAAEGRLSEAEHFFRTAVRIRPGLAEAHYDLGTALERRGKRGEAREHFRQALRIDPSDADAKNRIGVALVRLERWGESIPWFRAALRERPAHEDARFNLAIALDRTGARPEALLRLREYLRLRPGDPAAASTLAEWEGR